MAVHNVVADTPIVDIHMYDHVRPLVTDGADVVFTDTAKAKHKASQITSI